MNTKLLWETVTQNAEHIETINRELGEILTSLGWIKSIMICAISITGMILAGVVTNLLLIRRNGRR